MHSVTGNPTKTERGFLFVVVSPPKISNTPNSLHYILYAEKSGASLSEAFLPSACTAFSRCTNGSSNVLLYIQKIYIQDSLPAAKVTTLRKNGGLEENDTNPKSLAYLLIYLLTYLGRTVA